MSVGRAPVIYALMDRVMPLQAVLVICRPLFLSLSVVLLTPYCVKTVPNTATFSELSRKRIWAVGLSRETQLQSVLLPLLLFRFGQIPAVGFNK